MLMLFIFVASVLAFLLSSIAGGGAGLMLLPMLAVLLPAAQAPAALSIGTATSSISRLIVLRRRVRWDIVRWFVPAALPGAAIGAALLSRFEPLYVQLILGLFLTANLWPLLARRPREIRPSPADRNTGRLLLIGAAAGLLSGFTGAVGLLFNRFYHRMGIAPDEIVATRAANEVLLHLMKLALYATFGLLGGQAVYAGLLVAAGALVAAVATPSALARIQEALFRRIGLAAMVLAGVSMTASASAEVLARNGAGIAMSVEPHEIELKARWRHVHLSAEIDRVEGVVIERRMDVASLSLPLRARIRAAIGPGELISVEKTLGLSGRDWEIAYRHDGRMLEMDIPRTDDET